jgi:hypothetical protein
MTGWGRRAVLGFVLAWLFSTMSTTAAQSPAALSDPARFDEVARRCLGGSQPGRVRSNEAMVAADPRDRNRLVAVWQTFSGRGAVIQQARSTNGGATWSGAAAVPVNHCAGGPVADAPRTSDPWVAFGPEGRLYVSAIAWAPSPQDGPDPVSALVVVASPDGGTTWEPPRVAALAPAGVAHDNLAITADPTRSGTLYLATTRAEYGDSGRYFGRLGFARSEDGGRTWSAIRSISPRVNRERIGAPTIMVDPRSGRLYAVYHRRGGGAANLGVMSSSDRGETWTAETRVVTHRPLPRVRHAALADPLVMADDIVQTAVSPVTGRLFIAYADASRSDGARHGVSLVWSEDGARWSAPVAVSDSGAESAWLPAIAIAAGGEIGVSYFAADLSGGPEYPEMRVVLRRYRNESDRLTLLGESVLDRSPLAWPGDYHGLVATASGYRALFGRAAAERPRGDTDIIAR